MTTTTTTNTKAAGNGAAEAPRERASGLDYVRQNEAHCTASMASTAAAEAERLCRAVSQALPGPWDEDCPQAPGDDLGLRQRVDEAAACLTAALEHLRSLCLYSSEPPW